MARKFKNKDEKSYANHDTKFKYVFCNHFLLQKNQSIMEQLRQIQLTDADWSLNPEIMQILQLTLHPPHAVHNKKIVSSPTFPFCFYGSEGRLGQEHYCNAFQTTFNEYGLCYTFNNAHQGLQEYFSNETFWQRKGNFNLTKDFFFFFFSFSLFIFPLFDFT